MKIKFLFRSGSVVIGLVVILIINCLIRTARLPVR